MAKKLIVVILGLVFSTLTFVAPVLAVTVDSVTMIEQAKEYDKKIIIYEGEVIGDVMRRGTFAWVNVSDGSNAMGIWLSITDAAKIQYRGGYHYKGDTIRVTGVFHRACPEHGGDMDIHGERVEILKLGVKRSIALDNKYIYLSIILSFLACIFAYVGKKRQ